VSKMLFLLVFICMFLVFGVGVAFGGGEQAETANSINSIIAIGTALSACSGLGTLILLIQFRDDWKAPKIDKSRLVLITDIRRWERFFQLHIEVPGKLIKQSNEYNKHHEKLSKEIELEERYWLSLEASFDTLIYYVPTLKKWENKFKELSMIRREITDSICNLNEQFSDYQSRMGTQGISQSAFNLGFVKNKKGIDKITGLSESIVSGI
jgi:hypothetical protein